MNVTELKRHDFNLKNHWGCHYMSMQNIFCYTQSRNDINQIINQIILTQKIGFAAAFSLRKWEWSRNYKK